MLDAFTVQFLNAEQQFVWMRSKMDGIDTPVVVGCQLIEKREDGGMELYPLFVLLDQTLAERINNPSGAEEIQPETEEKGDSG